MQALIQQQAPTVAPAFDWKTRILTVTAGALLSASLFAQTPQTESDSMASRMIIELQQMREEMRELRGLVEAQTQEIENLKRRQRDQYLDLDARIGELSSQPTAQAPMPQVTTPVGTMPANTALQVSGTPPERVQSPPPPQDLPEVRDPVNTQAEIITLNAPSSASVREMQPPTEAEQQAYDQAFLALRETRYADAAEGFDRFLRDHPNSSYAPNAQYWLGEVYYVTRDFDTALGQF
ncbi:MAG: YbgF trimerization domain-containing protein, partial [Pseudomonadota bacterium]